MFVWSWFHDFFRSFFLGIDMGMSLNHRWMWCKLLVLCMYVHLVTMPKVQKLLKLLMRERSLARFAPLQCTYLTLCSFFLRQLECSWLMNTDGGVDLIPLAPLQLMLVVGHKKLQLWWKRKRKLDLRMFSAALYQQKKNLQFSRMLQGNFVRKCANFIMM